MLVGTQIGGRPTPAPTTGGSPWVGTALKVIGTGAVIGFGAAALAQVALRPARRHDALPSPEKEGCIGEIWAPSQRLDAQVATALPLPALLTLTQFPGFHLSGAAQQDALEALHEYFAAVEETDADEGTLLDFPGVEGSSIPDDGMVVGVTRALDRIENYRRFGAAAAASMIAPTCEWPEPFSSDVPADPKAAAIWQSLEHLAVVALASRDERQIRVDVEPTGTVLDDRLEACVPAELLRALRSPTTLAPELGGDAEDESWQLSHQGQITAFAQFQEHLADPDVTAPIALTAAAIAPRCPWGDKSTYGLRMTMVWHDLQRLEQLADQPEPEAP